MSSDDPVSPRQYIRWNRQADLLSGFLAKYAEGVYVLHAFEKRTKKTSERDTDLARERLRALIENRRSQKPAKR
jgi:phage-related protein